MNSKIIDNIKTCDLHVHSSYSDGTYTPREIVEESLRIGLSAVALTDHNTISGLDEFFNAAIGKDIETVGGIEVSTGFSNKDVHIVGLGVKPCCYTAITQYLSELIKRKEKSNLDLIKALNNGGYDLSFSELKEQALGGQFNRAHVAHALIMKGYFNSVDEVFSTVLKENGPYYVPPKRLCPYETISFLKRLGLKIILAHPFIDFNEEELRLFLVKAKKFGLDGMECDYSTYDQETTTLAHNIAKEFGLLVSGGSDFHGDRKPDIKLGVGRGNLKIPYDYYKRLK